MSTIKWELDPAHSQIRFTARHMIVSRVSGSFDKFNVTAETEDEKLETAKITFSADTATVNTGVEARDDHLRSDDFFNAGKYPRLTFESTSFDKIDDENYSLKGDLTIRDVTKPVTLDVEFGGMVKDPYGNQRVGFSVSGKIKRKDFGLKYNALLESGGAVVGDEIKIDCHVELTHQ